jgi:hypothetical protein
MHFKASRVDIMATQATATTTEDTMTTANSTDSLRFHIMPVDQGQMVEVAYAVDCDTETLVRRTRDGSDGSVSYDECDLDMDADDELQNFEPWNGTLPATTGEWRERA